MFFPSTHWSLLARASLNGEAGARSALEELCRRYWTPVNQFVQFRGHRGAEAEDLTQEFFLHVCQHSTFARADRMRGQFRSFLLGALVKFLAHERERRFAQKRGGQQPHVNVEMLAPADELRASALAKAETAEFDRTWALTVVRAALDRVERDYADNGKGKLFEVLRAFLPGGSVPPSYDEAAARAGLSLAAFNSEIHRLRAGFRQRICAEVTGTVSAPHEIDEEIAHLYQVLMDRGTDFRAIPES